MIVRAIAGWILYNTILIASIAVMYYIAGPMVTEWFVMFPVAITFAVCEMVIVASTIGPAIHAWIWGQ